MIADAPLWFLIALAIAATFSGAVASVVGFGIGSLLTPLLAARYGTELAIAAVALPHFAGGLLRGWRIRSAIDWQVLLRFGVLSACGGLLGAFLFHRLGSDALTRILGALLLVTSSAGLTRWSERWKPHGIVVWVIGGASGFFGGIVGNQGGLRAAALSTFNLSPAAFVATSTLIGVFVDVARIPIYSTAREIDLHNLWGLIALTACGVLAGTLIGERILFGLSPGRFRVAVSSAIGILGVWFLLGKL